MLRSIESESGAATAGSTRGADSLKLARPGFRPRSNPAAILFRESGPAAAVSRSFRARYVLRSQKQMSLRARPPANARREDNKRTSYSIAV